MRQVICNPRVDVAHYANEVNGRGLFTIRLPAPVTVFSPAEFRDFVKTCCVYLLQYDEKLKDTSGLADETQAATTEG